MGATGRTVHCSIPIFRATDTTGWLDGFNPAMETIDNLIEDSRRQGTETQGNIEEINEEIKTINEKNQLLSTNVENLTDNVQHLATDTANAATAADSATTAAENAVNTATTASETASTALEAANNATSASDDATAKATEASTKATDAASKADLAWNMAKGATQIADQAKASAESAANDAADALGEAGSNSAKLLGVEKTANDANMLALTNNDSGGVMYVINNGTSNYSCTNTHNTPLFATADFNFGQLGESGPLDLQFYIPGAGWRVSEPFSYCVNGTICGFVLANGNKFCNITFNELSSGRLVATVQVTSGGLTNGKIVIFP